MATTTTTTMMAAWAPEETWIEPVSVPDAPSLLSGPAFSGASPFPLDVAMAAAVASDAGIDEAGFVVDVGIDV